MVMARVAMWRCPVVVARYPRNDYGYKLKSMGVMPGEFV